MNKPTGTTSRREKADRLTAWIAEIILWEDEPRHTKNEPENLEIARIALVSLLDNIKKGW